jgi:predicted MFS family arabinose efflux permease
VAGGDLRRVFVHPAHLRAYGLMVALVLSGFSVGPFLADYLVANVGLTKPDLKYIYLCGGAVTLFTLTPIGGLADRFGKLPVFRIFAGLTVAAVLAIGYLPPLPLRVVLLVTTFFMVVTSGRMVPAMALITASAAPRWRGSFLSINSSVQQTAIGLAALVAGALLTRAPDGSLLGFERVGWLAAAATVVSIGLAGRLRSGEEETTDEAPESTPVPETASAA